MLKLESINTKTLWIILIAASVVFVAVCIAVIIAIKYKYESIAPKNIGFALTEIKKLMLHSDAVNRSDFAAF